MAQKNRVKEISEPILKKTMSPIPGRMWLLHICFSRSGLAAHLNQCSARGRSVFCSVSAAVASFYSTATVTVSSSVHWDCPFSTAPAAFGCDLSPDAGLSLSVPVSSGVLNFLLHTSHFASSCAASLCD